MSTNLELLTSNEILPIINNCLDLHEQIVQSYNNSRKNEQFNTNRDTVEQNQKDNFNQLS